MFGKLNIEVWNLLLLYKVKFMEQDMRLSCVWTSYKVKRTFNEAEMKKETESPLCLFINDERVLLLM